MLMLKCSGNYCTYIFVSYRFFNFVDAVHTKKKGCSWKQSQYLLSKFLWESCCKAVRSGRFFGERKLKIHLTFCKKYILVTPTCIITHGNIYVSWLTCVTTIFVVTGTIFNGGLHFFRGDHKKFKDSIWIKG